MNFSTYILFFFKLVQFGELVRSAEEGNGEFFLLIFLNISLFYFCFFLKNFFSLIYLSRAGAVTVTIAMNLIGMLKTQNRPLCLIQAPAHQRE